MNHENNILRCCDIFASDVWQIPVTWPTTYRQRANIKFLEYAKPIVEQFFVYGVKPKSLSVKKWTNAGAIVLQTDIYPSIQD